MRIGHTGGGKTVTKPTRRWILSILAAVLLWPTAVHGQSPELMEAYGRYQELNAEGRYQKAIPFAEEALRLGEKELGPDDLTTAILVNNLGLLYRDQGRYTEAEPLFQRALAINEKALGPDHPEVATNLNNLALLYHDQARYAEAGPLYVRALEIKEKTLGPKHPDVATSLNNLAELYRIQGNYRAAEPLYRRALAIDEKALGPEHPYVAGDLSNLGGLYHDQGRYTEAEPLYWRALAIDETALGPGHPEVATDLNNLAVLFHDQGRYAEAETLYVRALVLREEALGSQHPEVATSLNNLALLYYDQGRYAEAEPFYKRALEIDERALGPDHPDLATRLNNLATLYLDQDRYAEAELLYERALAIDEKALGPEHPYVATSLNNLAHLYSSQARYAEAEPLYQRALAVGEKALGLEHPDVATSLNNLAALYDDQGRYAEAEPLYQRSLSIREKTLGPEHPDVAQSFNNLAKLYHVQGKFREAEQNYQRALSIWEKALGPRHPHVATSLNNLAELSDNRGRYAEALERIRLASGIHRARAARSSDERSSGALSEQKSVRYVFVRHVSIAMAVAEETPSSLAPLIAETFEAAQLALATSVAGALARMAARFAPGDDALAALVRARQDALDRWQQFDEALLVAASRPPDERDEEIEAGLHAELAGLNRRLDKLDARLAGEFPDYAELATPRPLALAETQALLGPEEALLAYLVTEDETYLWVARRDGAEIFRLEIGREELNLKVELLRARLDPTGRETIPEFDVALAHELYETLFAPAEPALEGVHHIFIVPDAGLGSLPLGVLVTKPLESEIAGYADYRQVAWLVKRYALTVLPSVSSLKALRRFAGTASAAKPFIGFGDPVLDGSPGSGRSIELAALFTHGAVADVEAVRDLPALPETAGELAAIAQTLGASAESLYLGERAGEGRVRALDLSDYRVLAFATHGLVAGNLSGLAEPALVLTPPLEGTAQDDGLLTASEIAQLELDADWVILSACNTAAADGSPGGEGLSGLAKAFFYAGSRALLVSHWPVFSDPAVKLTTGMFEETAADPTLGGAEALRRSMLALMDDTESPHYAHPMFWAPFIVVGEGGVPGGS